jgi:hypothetical protein
MSRFRVEFHFDKDDSVTYFADGENRASVLEEFGFKNDERFLDFVSNEVHYRIDMNKVKYVAVNEHKPARVRGF